MYQYRKMLIKYYFHAKFYKSGVHFIHMAHLNVDWPYSNAQ